MRPTGRLHLGHLHGVVKNWIKLQHEYECFFFIADWHALTTHYDNPQIIDQNVWDMVIDSGYCGHEPTTVVDLVDGAPQVLRHGKADPEPFL